MIYIKHSDSDIKQCERKRISDFKDIEELMDFNSKFIGDIPCFTKCFKYGSKHVSYVIEVADNGYALNLPINIVASDFTKPYAIGPALGNAVIFSCFEIAQINKMIEG